MHVVSRITLYILFQEYNYLVDGEIVEMVVLTLIYGVKSAGNQTMVAFKVVAELLLNVFEC